MFLQGRPALASDLEMELVRGTWFVRATRARQSHIFALARVGSLYANQEMYRRYQGSCFWHAPGILREADVTLRTRHFLKEVAMWR